MVNNSSLKFNGKDWIALGRTHHVNKPIHIKAGDINIGTKIKYGFYSMYVTEIVKETAKMITIRLKYSNWHDHDGIVKAFRKSTLLSALIKSENRI